MSTLGNYANRLALIGCALMLLCAGGCCFCSKVRWHEPAPVAPATTNTRFCPDRHTDVETLYAAALHRQQKCSASCVDLFFEVAVRTADHQICCHRNCRKFRLHRSALQQLIAAAQKYGRLDTRQGLTIYRAGIPHQIPVHLHGFVWKAHDFSRIIPVGDYQTKTMSKAHRRPGIGIPLVVQRHGRDGQGFLPQELHFAATLLLNVHRADKNGDLAVVSSLEFYDPLRLDHASIDNQDHALAKDLTAPLVYSVKDERSNYLDDFINSGQAGREGRLHMVEPFQTEKIPVVLIHGLLSDPYTWIEMFNELRAVPGFVNDFQLWVYEYPTGQAFLSSAAQLRKQLEQIRCTFDPGNTNVHLSNSVLIGHSMGGLIAKLQVASSGNALWNSVSNRPFDQVLIDPQWRTELAKAFFFQPSKIVTRTIFIATPHRGSYFAKRCIGRVGAAFVQIPEEDQQRLKRLVADNPGVISDEVSRRIPTSIDLLNPDSELLRAIAALPIGQRVCLHSIIGDHCGTLCQGRTDGIVPVESAREPRAATELTVKARHSAVNEHPETIEEVLAILYEQKRALETKQPPAGSSLIPAESIEQPMLHRPIFLEPIPHDPGKHESGIEQI